VLNCLILFWAAVVLASNNKFIFICDIFLLLSLYTKKIP
jgi:hypothetical protein